MKVAVFFLASILPLMSEVLTDTGGRSIEVAILQVDVTGVLVRKGDGTEVKIPLEKLSVESRTVVESWAKAAPPAILKNPKLTLVSNASGRTTDEMWETSWGSYDKDVYRSRKLTATVKADSAGEAVLEVHWIGSIAGYASKKGVVLVSKKPVTLAANTPQSHEFAALFVESDANYEALGVRDRNGIKYAGWVARLVTTTGDVLVTVGSRPPLIEMLKLPALAE